MSTKYAVKYGLAQNHTGRLHNTIRQAADDLAACGHATGKGVHRDLQAIGLVAVEGDDMRPLTEVEDEQLFDLLERSRPCDA
jgi:hypothetical protein